MRTLFRACAAALPLLAALLPPPIAAQPTRGGWSIIEADDTGLPLAVFPLEQNPTLGGLALVCTEQGGLVLRVDVRSSPSPSTVFIRNEAGEMVTLKVDDTSAGSAAELLALSQLGGGPEISVRSDREGRWASYAFRDFNDVRTQLGRACLDPSAAPTIAEAPPAPRSRVASGFEDYCLRHARGDDKQAQCACLVDNIVRIADRDDPGVPNYPDVVLRTIRAIRESRITGSSPEYAVRMSMIGMPGNPAADPATLIVRSIAVNDEAVGLCARQ